jgi:pilus assembly protein Flp/PilA
MLARAQTPATEKQCRVENLRVINLPMGIKPYSGFNGASSEGRQVLFFMGNGQSPFSMVPGVVYYLLMEFTMSKFISAVKTFVSDENGVTAIEYGLIAALVGLALITGATLLGTKLSDSFTFIAGKMKVA